MSFMGHHHYVNDCLRRGVLAKHFVLTVGEMNSQTGLAEHHREVRSSSSSTLPVAERQTKRVCPGPRLVVSFLRRWGRLSAAMFAASERSVLRHRPDQPRLHQ
jgi:hypothetical protein